MKHKITITRNSDGNISIKLDEEEKLVIDSNNKVKASQIYDSLEYVKGEEYEMIELSIESKNDIVITEIYNFYDDIIKEINTLSESKS
jgi:RNA processing factor Prp31